jgi:hypothetical protein
MEEELFTNVFSAYIKAYILHNCSLAARDGPGTVTPTRQPAGGPRLGALQGPQGFKASERTSLLRPEWNNLTTDTDTDSETETRPGVTVTVA